MEDAELYYKPCNVDVDNGTFVSRSILIRYSGEEASLRDSCCWRIEVPYEDINDSSLSFTVELYSHCPIQSDKRVTAYAEKPTVGAIRICDVASWDTVHYDQTSEFRCFDELHPSSLSRPRSL